jgi:hypothetical protein
VTGGEADPHHQRPVLASRVSASVFWSLHKPGEAGSSPISDLGVAVFGLPLRATETAQRCQSSRTEHAPVRKSTAGGSCGRW